MLSQLAIRFLIGGCVVSAFSVLGETFKPRTFSGIFGAAPSVALATLTLELASTGPGSAAIQGRSMAIGGVSLAVYGLLSAWLALQPVPIWLATAILWIVWLAVALGLGWLVLA